MLLLTLLLIHIYQMLPKPSGSQADGHRYGQIATLEFIALQLIYCGMTIHSKQRQNKLLCSNLNWEN